MLRRGVVILILCGLSGLPGVVAARGDSSAAPSFASHISIQLQRLRHQGQPRSAGEPLHHLSELVSAYQLNGYKPIWTHEQGWQPKAEYLFEYLENLYKHGINAAPFHVDALRTLRQGQTLATRIHSDLLLTDAFLGLLQQLTERKAAPSTRSPDPTRLLLRLKPGDDPARLLDKRLPDDAEYWALTRALQSLLAEGPSALTSVRADLRIGDRGPEVLRLARRLRELGDYTGPDDELYSAPIDLAVRQFQARHGLDADGIVGPTTRTQLNATREARIDQIVSNLERRRQAQLPSGDSHIRVNIAAQQLRYIHAGETALEMKVIVGRPARPTPVTRSAINEVVLNPDWTVPYGIATRDKLPLIRQDPDYLPSHGFTVQAGWQSDAPYLDPRSIDWNRVSADNFPYVLRQRPGANNALGRVKFLFPNKYSVYLHDTPNHGLFDREQRLFSSGCVRLSQPMALAASLLRHHGTPEQLQSLEAAGDRHSMVLAKPVPVSLEYWTAWVDHTGSLQFRPDIYGHDTRLLTELAGHGRLATAQQLLAARQSADGHQFADAGTAGQI